MLAGKTRWTARAIVTMLLCVGLMSGTSMDAIDAAAIVVEDGHVKEFGDTVETTLSPALREKITALSQRCRDDVSFARKCAAIQLDPSRKHDADIGRLEVEITELHATAVHALLNQLKRQDNPLNPLFLLHGVEVVGFHGQTIYHHPQGNGPDRFTWQLGDGKLLASLLGLRVVSQFRVQDVQKGGEGAPLAPLYHAALLKSPLSLRGAHAQPLTYPVAIVNIGGVSNVTFVFEKDPPLAFDCGPGNALMDDQMFLRTGVPVDHNGTVAGQGMVQDYVINDAMVSYREFLARRPPKSLDRNVFVDMANQVQGLSTEDAMATLARFTAVCIGLSTIFLKSEDAAPTAWFVCGGGRHNATLVRHIIEEVQAPVYPVEHLGWRGDSVEAECFGYLASRVLRGEHTSLPTTTGCAEPVCGGRVDPS